MPALSDRVGTFTDSVIRRMTRISDEYGAINLSQGFPDFDPPAEILDALARVAHEGPHQYSITFGAENFREALARKQSRAIGREIDPEKEIVVTCGGTESMMCAVMTICNPGDKIIVFSPFYENYGADTILSGAEPIYVPLVPPEYHFDLSLVEEGFRQGAKGIIVCNPSNPCGKVFTREELMGIGQLALQYDAFVITDEVYEHMVYAPNHHVCMASLPGMYEHTITCNSLSKTYNLTGARISFVLGNRQIIQTFRRLRSQIDYGIFLPVQYAAIAALNGPQDSVARNRAEYQARRDALCGGLRSIGWDVPDSQGSMFVWAPLPKGYHNSVDFCFELLERSGLLCTPGSAFGELGERHVRFALVQPVPVMQEIVAAVAKSGIIDHEA